MKLLDKNTQRNYLIKSFNEITTICYLFFKKKFKKNSQLTDKMNINLLKLSDLTKEELQMRDVYLKKRLLYNKYSNIDLDDWTKIDLYEALDLDGLRYETITPDILAKAIKLKTIRYHPMKGKQNSQSFELIMKAKKIFSSPLYKKLYDSIMLVETIPEDREYELEEFYRVFSIVFKRNGVFSEIQPVPKITGNIEAFYKFWFNFKSTRMYENPDDVFQRPSSHRKYYADKNKDLIAKKKENDAKRIYELVKIAYKRDPRIKRAPTTNKPWSDNETKALVKFNMLMGKHKDKYNELSKRLNNMFLIKRTDVEIKQKLDSLKKK